jgi:hypothetical protein
MPSLRTVAQCIGVEGDISVVHDFFGLRSVPPGKQLFLKRQMERLELRHFHVNVILVGVDEFLPNELGTLNRAVFDAREIYAKFGIGVGRILWFGIPVSMAGGHGVISSNDEATALTNSWTVHNDGLDVFVVRDGWVEDGKNVEGVSNPNASCDKDARKSISGSVVSVKPDSELLLAGVLLAHEMAHDLGLEDNLEERNLMFFKVFTTTTELHPWQVAIMLGHCLMQPGC